jgi:Lysyl oxidase
VARLTTTLVLAPAGAALAAAALATAAPGQGSGAPASQAGVGQNPCLVAEKARQLRCPDLVMKRPFGLYVDRRTRRGRTLLRAGNSLDNVGRGPVELHGVRIGRSHFMRGRQRIYRRGGGRIGVRTGARLYFKYVAGQVRYWKFHRAARFELWRLDGEGHYKRLSRRGPKVSYCLRDLRRTRPRSRSPRRRVYPACNTSRRIRRVTIGTSVGWSDIYPPTYPEQWIDVTGLRGCFAYRHVADPANRIYESNEDNNKARVIVRLPFRRRGARPCPGQSGRTPARQPTEYGY